MVSDSIPQKLLDESMYLGLVYTHMHSIARTPKILTFVSWWMVAGNKNTPSMLHPRRQNVTTSIGRLKKLSHLQKSQNMVNPIAGNTEEEGIRILGSADMTVMNS